MPLKQYTLAGAERLKSRKQIDLVFKEGARINIFPLRVSFILEKGTGDVLQFGVGVSGKLFKKAVDRNRVKRLARESWRVQKNDLRQMLTDNNLRMVVFAVYTGKELPVYETIYQAMAGVIEKLSRSVHETIEANP